MKKYISLIFVIVAIVYITAIVIPDSQSPDYDIQDIIPLLSKSNFSLEDYKVFLLQTGLGKQAIDTLVKSNNGKLDILKFQNSFFNPPNTSIDMLTPITIEEVYVNQQKQIIHGFKIAPIEKGDIFITKSTNTLGIQHGHAAIVTDAQNNITLEAFTIGEPSNFQNLNHFRRYSTFIVLRLKDVGIEKRSEIADYAIENLTSLNYNPFAGIFKKIPDIDNMRTTQCAHIVWYPFMISGYDIDSNKGTIVLPSDIAKSPILEIIQIYGLNPEDVW